jgi:aerobic carbon-monoxide dehydrogenase large subunit
MIGTNRYIGSPVERIEDPRFLRGRGQFVGDLKRESMLHAAILRSPVAHGLIAAVDASAPLAIAGVRAVITAKDIGNVPRIPLRLLPLPGTERFLQPVIAADRVRYVGEPVAVVLGDSPALAEDGVGAIALDIEELPPVPDRHASGRGETLLFEEAGTNAAMVFTGVKGDADAAFRDADYVRRDRFIVQRYTALPMEPRGVLAEWDAAQGRMTVLGAAKVPFFNRDTLAAMLGLSPAQVDLIENDVGGGFGARGEFYPEDFLIPFAARHVGRPVRWLEDRREHLTAMNHARQADCDVEIACRSDGTILGLRGEVFVDLGAYVRTNGLDRATQRGAMLYRPVSRAECADDFDSAAHQQDPVRHLSRARPLRGLVFLRAAHRAGGARLGDRQRRDAPAQPDRRRRDAVPTAAAGAGRSGPRYRVR